MRGNHEYANSLDHGGKPGNWKPAHGRWLPPGIESVAARSAEKLAEVAKEIGPEAFALEMDLANRDSITSGMARAAKEFDASSIGE